jgi:hypothetical protein
MSRKLNRAVSKELKELLGESAPIEFQDEMTIRLMSEGEHRGKSNARVIAEGVMDQARKGDKWAIDFIADRTEGKAATAGSMDDADRALDEALHDVTIRHLNDLARAADPAPVGADSPPRQAAGDDGRQAGPADRTGGPASPFMDLPPDRDSDPEDD